MSQALTRRRESILSSQSSLSLSSCIIMEFAARPARRLCESAADSFDIDTISADKKKKKRKEKTERHRGGGKKKDDRMPVCQQVDKGLKRVHVPAQIFASPHLARVLFGLLPFVNNGCRFERARSERD